MNIPMGQAGKLGKYFENADPFLWGVLAAKNKKGRLKELKEMGFLTSYAGRQQPAIYQDQLGICWWKLVSEVF